MAAISRSGNPANTNSISLEEFKNKMRIPRSGQFYLLHKPLQKSVVQNALDQIASALENETKAFLST